MYTYRQTDRQTDRQTYQIIAVAVRKAVAGVHIAMHHMRYSSYRIVKPPSHLVYLLPPRQQAH